MKNITKFFIILSLGQLILVLNCYGTYCSYNRYGNYHCSYDDGSYEYWNNTNNGNPYSGLPHYYSNGGGSNYTIYYNNPQNVVELTQDEKCAKKYSGTIYRSSDGWCACPGDANGTSSWSKESGCSTIENSEVLNKNIDCDDPSVKLACSMGASSCPSNCRINSNINFQLPIVDTEEEYYYERDTRTTNDYKVKKMDNCDGPGICNNILHGQNPYIKDGEYEIAYNWAYEYKMTTMPSLEDANIYAPITRAEFAKMVTNFATNVMGWDIDYNKSCSFKDDKIGGDLEVAIQNSCRLGLMGQGTKYFNPYGNITRGEVATILYRIIYPNETCKSNPYYQCYYDELYNQTTLTKTGGPTDLETRGNIFIMLNRSCLGNGIYECNRYVMDGNEFKYYNKNKEKDFNEDGNQEVIETGIQNNTVSSSRKTLKELGYESCEQDSAIISCKMEIGGRGKGCPLECIEKHGIIE